MITRTFINPMKLTFDELSFKIAVAVVNALYYLHANLKVIHRDVKPSNILINRRGEVKMCDFGISGYLVDSVAKTIDAGCKRKINMPKIFSNLIISMTN